MSWYKDLVTTKDGMSHDLGRWSWVASFFTILGHTAWSLYHGVAVSVVDLGQAIATVTGAHGLALWAKKDTEPNDPEVK